MTLLDVIIIALLLCLVMYFTAKFISVKYTIERSIFVDAPPSMLWAIIVDHDERDWRNNILEVVKQRNEDGMTIWKEVRRDKETFVLQTTESDATNFVLERKIIENKKYGGTYRFEIAEEDAGSRIKLKHYSEVHTPILRLKHLILPATKSVFANQYLSDIKHRALYVREERDGYLG